MTAEKDLVQDKSMVPDIERAAALYNNVKKALDDYALRTKLNVFSSEAPQIMVAMVLDALKSNPQTQIRVADEHVSLDALLTTAVEKLKPSFGTAPAPQLDLESLAADIASQVSQRMKAEGSNLAPPSLTRENMHGAPQKEAYTDGRVPYVVVSAKFSYIFINMQEKVSKAKRILERIESLGWQPFPNYKLLDEKQPYRQETLEQELSIVDQDMVPGDRWDNADFIFKKRESPGEYLEVLLVLNEDDGDCLKLYLTKHVPEFISGVHNMEDDFQPEVKKRLIDLANTLEKEFGDPEHFTYNEETIHVEERADWFSVEDVDEDE